MPKKLIKKRKIQPQVVAFGVSDFHISKLIRGDAKEKLKKAFGKEVIVPAIALVAGDETVFIMYEGEDAYKKGKCTLLSRKKETVQKYVDIIGEI